MAAKKKTTRKKTAKKRAARTKPDLKPVETITKTFKGTKHTVRVTEDGFRHQGSTYRSLTAVAKAITQYDAVSGPRFFGLDQNGGSK